MELAHLHDWNVIQVPDGMSFQQIVAAQRRARSLANGQPTAIVYRTVKGWRYGIEGRASHGAGHKLCADGFFDALEPFLKDAHGALPRCAADNQRCAGGEEPGVMDECFWEALGVIRGELEDVHAAHAAHRRADRAARRSPGRTSTHAARGPPAARGRPGAAREAGLATPAELR